MYNMNNIQTHTHTVNQKLLLGAHAHTMHKQMNNFYLYIALILYKYMKEIFKKKSTFWFKSERKELKSENLI